MVEVQSASARSQSPSQRRLQLADGLLNDPECSRRCMDPVQPELLRKLPLAVQQLIDADAAQLSLQLLLSGHSCTLQTVHPSAKRHEPHPEQLCTARSIAGLPCWSALTRHERGEPDAQG